MGTGRVLVTGARGFIGRPVVAALLEGGWEVHACSRRPPDENRDRVMWHAADLLSPETPRLLVHEIAPTHLLHLGWCAQPGSFWTDPANLTWAHATLRLAEEFAGAGGKRFVGVGSCAEYDWSTGLCREDFTALLPTTLYGSAKLATGMILTAWGRQVGLSVAWARLFHLYGPGEPPGKLVSSIVAALRTGHPIELSEGGQERDFLHVSDAASGLVQLLRADAVGPINVASGRATKVREVADELGRVTGQSELLQFGTRPTEDSEPPLIVADVRRISAIGWAPEWDLKDGLRELLRTEGLA